MDSKIITWINRKLVNDAEFMEDCLHYDRMEKMDWTPPPGFTARQEIRIRVSTDAHDILKTATNLFDVHHPKWDILPRGPMDSDQAERLERWLEWHMKLANMHGDQEAFRVMLKHSTKYNRITAQLEYLPYWCKKDSAEYREALNNPFCITVHNPANVHYEMGSYGLRKVVVVSCIPAADVIDKWDAYRSDPEYGKTIDAALKKIEKILENDDEAKLVYADYTDKDRRQVAAYLSKGDMPDTFTPPTGKELITILDAENKLPFINWVISVGTSDPLLYSLHKGGLWENQCFLDTIADTTVIRRGWFPLLSHTSVSGKPLEVDYSGAEAVIELNAADGESAQILTPPPLDPGIRELMDRNSQKAASATGLKGLQNMNIAGNVQFATVNAMLQVSKSTLDPYIRNFEKAAVELARLAFQWVDFMDDVVTGYRSADKSKDKNMVRGEKINVGREDFDPKTLMIQCELLANTATDQLQQVNMYNMMAQANWPVPKSEFVERMGLGAPEVLYDRWMKEKIEEIALQVFAQTQQAQAQLMVQQMAQQMQQQALMQQQQNPMAGMVPPQQGVDQPMTDAMQGMDPNSGGAPPAMVAPQATQTYMRQA